MRLMLVPQGDQNRDYWLLHCPKVHVDPRAKPQGIQFTKQEPIYRVPKSLLPEDYFFVPDRK
jgi:hypothetical protein